MISFKVIHYPTRDRQGVIQVLKQEFKFVNKLGYDDGVDSIRMAAINAMSLLLDNSPRINHGGDVGIFIRYRVFIVYPLYHAILKTILKLYFAPGGVDSRSSLVHNSSVKICKAFLLIINGKMCSLSGSLIDYLRNVKYTAMTHLRSSMIPDELVSNVTCPRYVLMPDCLCPNTTTEENAVKLAEYYTSVSSAEKVLIVKEHPISHQSIDVSPHGIEYIKQHFYKEELTPAQEDEVVRIFRSSFDLRDESQQRKLDQHVIDNINKEAVSELNPSPRKPNPAYENENTDAITPSFKEITKRRYIAVDEQMQKIMGTFVQGRSLAMSDLLRTFPGSVNCSRSNVQTYIENLDFSDFSETMEKIEKSQLYNNSKTGKIITLKKSQHDHIHILGKDLSSLNLDIKFIIGIFNNRWEVTKYFIKICAEIEDKAGALSLIEWEESSEPEVKMMKSLIGKEQCPNCYRTVRVAWLKNHQRTEICKRTGAEIRSTEANKFFELSDEEDNDEADVDEADNNEEDNDEADFDEETNVHILVHFSLFYLLHYSY